jgi:hypothetical protein
MPSPQPPSSPSHRGGPSRAEHEALKRRVEALEEARVERPWVRLKKWCDDIGDSESTTRRRVRAGVLEFKSEDGRSYVRLAADPPPSTKSKRQLPRGDTEPNGRRGWPPKADQVITDPTGPQFPFGSAEGPRSQ